MINDEQLGIKAIIYLQSLANIDESEDDARKGWQAMSDHEKEQTLAFYKMIQKS